VCAPIRNPSYIYTCNDQSKVLITGTFTALSTIVSAEVRKLSVWRCCECFSCECCVVLVSCSPDWQRILYYRRLGKSSAKIACCLTKEEHRATKVGVQKFLHQRRNVPRKYYTNMLHLPRLVLKLALSQEGTSS